jgi:hypothetical protein
MKKKARYMHYTNPNNSDVGEALICSLFDPKSKQMTMTNYWESKPALGGFVGVSFYGGIFSMLIPPQVESYIGEMKTGKHVVISKGFDIKHNQERYEFMFEDDSDAPFSITVNPYHFDRLPVLSDNGKQFKFLVLSEGLKPKLEMTAYYRIVETLPCFKPLEIKL